MITPRDIAGKSGLYIVTLKNEELISVNSNDKRIADNSIKVNFLNCKFGKAKNLKAREKQYQKVFGIENVVFIPLVFMTDIDRAESEILTELLPFRIRGRTGRPNEWLDNIAPIDVVKLAFKLLYENRYIFDVYLST